jgi:hypothetical protein
MQMIREASRKEYVIMLKAKARKPKSRLWEATEHMYRVGLKEESRTKKNKDQGDITLP